ncbi:MAG: short-chain dehydrogenase/reductase SDR [Magnetococcales bacterium]|nr:short-chain dehydrogenase/reductase SDR [Magnetococcales bacterium]HIJ83449.1 SDR family oxidoreductase [Magnetococcales bacterium]
MNRFVKGLRLALALVLGLPFLVFLLPIFLVYVFVERRAGRPLPFDFKALWASAFDRNEQTITPRSSPPNSDAVFRSNVVENLDRATRDDLNQGGADPENLRTNVKTIGIALVTHGGSPLGGEICRNLARLGYRVGVAWQHDREIADGIVTTIRQMGGEADALFLDLGNPDKIQNFISEAEKMFGGSPDLLVNNVAHLIPTPIQDTSWEMMSSALQINLQGPMWLALKVAVRMTENRGGGHIIHVMDLFGERPLKGYLAYSAARAGLIMATKALAGELGPKVRVNAVAPGAMITFEIKNEEKEQGKASAPPLWECIPQVQPKAVISALRYLLDAHWVTGEVLHVDGGRRMFQIGTSPFLG